MSLNSTGESNPHSGYPPISCGLLNATGLSVSITMQLIYFQTNELASHMTVRHGEK